MASSLPINDNLINQGLLNNPDSQFLLSALPLAAGKNGTPAFTPSAPLTLGGSTGDVVVQAGAQISSPTTSDHVGGRVALIGGNVSNSGTLTTPDGQTILASGLQVGMVAHASSDASLRGLDVYIGAVADSSATSYGSSANSGLIDASRASVRMSGKTVAQNGVISSSTSVALNGRIDLDSSYAAVSNQAYDSTNSASGQPFLATATGSVSFGSGSSTAILPEWSSTQTIVGTQLALPSQINVWGKTIHAAANSSIVAPSAAVSLNAGVWDYVSPTSTFVLADGQIYLDSGALVYVAGSTDVAASVTENIVSAQLLGTELADSPLLRNSVLRGSTIQVDMTRSGTYNGKSWIGTPIADVSGYANLIERNIGELTTTGGTVKLNAGASVVLSTGAKVEVAGGWTNYQGATVQTTRVLANGHLIDIADATPDMVYQAIVAGDSTYGSTKWGVTQTFSTPFVAGSHIAGGYVLGGSGGSLKISAPAVALDGTMQGGVFVGSTQRSTPPMGSSLSLVFQRQQNLSPLYLQEAPAIPPQIVFGEAAAISPLPGFAVDSSGVPSALPTNRQANVNLSPTLLTTGGFANLRVENGEGGIQLPLTSALTTSPGGSISLAAANLEILGSMTAPSGSLTLTAYNISPFVAAALKTASLPVTPPPNAGRGVLHLASTATLSTAGLLVDDRPDSATALSLPLITRGGNIAVDCYTGNFDSGSKINVGGGVSVSAKGAISYGDAGSLAIRSGQDSSIRSVVGGSLQLGAELLGMSGAKGGSLSLVAPQIQLGGSSMDSNTLVLEAGFFDQGGFSSYALTGIGSVAPGTESYNPAILVASGTSLAPVTLRWLADIGSSGLDGISLNSMINPQSARSPVSLSLTAQGVIDDFSQAMVVRGDLRMQANSVIDAGAYGSVTLKGDTLAVMGTIQAAGGSIAISGPKKLPTNATNPLNAFVTVLLAPGSVLSTAGGMLTTPNGFGYHTGIVLAGGSITVTGNVAAQSGATLDVSGGSAVLDMPSASLTSSAVGDSSVLGVPVGLAYRSARIDSNGGSIALTGNQELFCDATLTGRAGGPTATGGSLSIASGAFHLSGTDVPPNDLNLIVKQSGLSLPAGVSVTVAKPVVDVRGNELTAHGYFSADAFQAGGFDSLTLGGNVQFSGAVSIQARRNLTVATGGVIAADGAVSLSASYVALGMAFQAPVQPQQIQGTFFSSSGLAYNLAPTFGSGSLRVSADLIDIGTLLTQGIGSAELIALNGDIRGNGSLDVSGALTLGAGQIYPTSGGTFTVAVYDYTTAGTTNKGSITISGGASRPVPYSACGQLNLYASSISQGGTLRAPFGQITLGWNGSGTSPSDLTVGNLRGMPVTASLTLAAGSITSVSAIDPVSGQGLSIPYGKSPDGTTWYDPSGFDITSSGMAAKAIRLSAQSVVTTAGSLVDIRGGGDVFAYQWVQGTGGSTDILASNSSFAILPGYAASYAPYAAFNTPINAPSLANDGGYVSSGLALGERIWLAGGNALAAGYYTLLPARYATLAGAFLVTPKSGQPAAQSVVAPGGASVMAGVLYSGLDAQVVIPAVLSEYEVAPAAVVAKRAQYNLLSANTTLAASAGSSRLPVDSGQLSLAATLSMTIGGAVNSVAHSGGRGGIVDISSPLDIVIRAAGAAADSGKLLLDSTQLSSFGAESLLIGGSRHTGSSGVTVEPSTNNLTVDNAGGELSGSDILLVAKQALNVAAGARVVQDAAHTGTADAVALGTTGSVGSGDGALLRVSADATAGITRYGVDGSNVPNLIIAGGAKLIGTALILDSTSGTSLSSSAILTGSSVSMNSGQVSIQLDNPGALWLSGGQASRGLVLSGTALSSLQASVNSLSLLSYSSMDLYGSGSIGGANVASMALHAAEIRGFNTGSGQVSLLGKEILIDNSPNGVVPGVVTTNHGTLSIAAGTLRLGSHITQLDQFDSLVVQAQNGVIGSGTGGLASSGSMTLTTPILTTGASATQSISVGGTLLLQQPGTPATAVLTGGAGGSLTLTGSSVSVNSEISLPSGMLGLRATSGDITVGGSLVVEGTARIFQDVTKFSSGGNIHLSADHGSVNLSAGGRLSVAANPGGGDAGSLSVFVPQGTFHLASTGTILGQAGAGGLGGSWALDAGSPVAMAALDGELNTAGFALSRTLRVRSGDVILAGSAQCLNYTASADAGSLSVSGTIDASGATGGTIDLKASGNLTLLSGSLLNAAGLDFSNAGKGGRVTLAAGCETNGSAGAGVLTLALGSRIELAVASRTPASAGLGRFTGQLHLRAPVVSGGTDLAIAPMAGTIDGASVIVAEGVQIFDLTAAGGAISSAAQTAVRSAASTFSSYSAAISTRLLAGNTGLVPVLEVLPGAELINRNGNLTLGSLTSTSTSDWDFSGYRFGPNGVPGILTLKAAGDVVLYNSLSDGFSSADYASQLLGRNASMPANLQSWSFQITAGADFAAADPLAVNSTASGSVLLGKDGKTNIVGVGGVNVVTSTITSRLYQVIRTGTGDIGIAAAKDLRLLNQLASIYTAGAVVNDATLGGSFDVPIPNMVGNIQQRIPYPAQYTMAGGNVSVHALGDIIHYTTDAINNLIADSSKEMPTNWLYRRGYVAPDGQFGLSNNKEIASTSWWVDFSNFFGGVATLGGGDVSLVAGKQVSNVDAAVATNARMPKGAPNAASLVELGGGNLTVKTGTDIDGGVYYVERGHGTLDAGGSIHTNSTRSPSLTTIKNPSDVYAPQTWLPTTLFLGKGSFDVFADGNILLGPVANPFLLPQGYNNTYWYKTYFSTYAPDSSVSAVSLAGNITMRSSVTLPTTSTSQSVSLGTAIPMLQAWYQNQLLYSPSPRSASYYQPWLRLTETSVTPFSTGFSLFPGSLSLVALNGDVNLAGGIKLAPASAGSLAILATGSVNGLQITGTATTTQAVINEWGSSTINLSDADPASIPGTATPVAYQSLLAQDPNSSIQRDSKNTNGILVSFLDPFFAESGSTNQVLQTKQRLHGGAILHAGDSQPLRIYASSGDISGLTLYSAKELRVVAGRDITDVAFYSQNLGAADVSLVSAGRDITAYDAASLLRSQATATGNALNLGEHPLAGDIQMGGPGTLEVLAGRNLDLGSGASNADGTGSGITSIGNARNPYLPFTGAAIIAGAGIGNSGSLAASQLDFSAFITQFIKSADGTAHLLELGLTQDQFDKRDHEQQDQLALEVFYLVLRDAGRDHGRPQSPGYRNYDAGEAAIAALFPGSGWSGSINTQERDIRTKNGGDISLFAPGGSLALASIRLGNPLTPPGIVTEAGGNINVFTRNNVDLGISRIFTLRGGNEIIWSSVGNIAAGSSSKTVQAAPPTRVLIDPQSADVKTDLAGLATGGGIGVLTSVAGVRPGNVDLIAPVGTIDAGDAGIRVSGNLNISAAIVTNAGNISAGGTSSGTTAAGAPAAPSVSSISAASNTAAAGNTSVAEAGRHESPPPAPAETALSIINVEVIGYGGAGDNQDEEDKADSNEKP
ncbi:MAG: filamentous hemagglutinin family protein [Verrucomicrobiota bacterium]